jgi:hypothetical protein
MINILRNLGFMLCDFIDDLADSFEDFGFTENDF